MKRPVAATITVIDKGSRRRNMRIKFVIALVSAVVCLLPIITGVSTAQQDNPNKANLDYLVYLPFVSKPTCSYTVTSTQASLSAYVVASSPVVRLGDIITATGAIVNDGCRGIYRPYIGIGVNPPGILSPTVTHPEPWDPVPPFGYELVQIPMLATGIGQGTMTVQMVYEPGPALIGVVRSAPTVIRVLPNP